MDGLTPVIPLNISIAVTGESPAQNVIGRALIIPTRFEVDLIEIQKSYCNKVAKEKFTILKEDLDDGYVIQRTIGPGHKPDIIVIATGDGNQFRQDYAGGRLYVSPAAVGCIFYKTADGSQHWSGFIYGIFSKENRGLIELRPFELIKANDITVRQNPIGDGTAN